MNRVCVAHSRHAAIKIKENKKFESVAALVSKLIKRCVLVFVLVVELVIYSSASLIVGDKLQIFAFYFPPFCNRIHFLFLFFPKRCRVEWWRRNRWCRRENTTTHHTICEIIIYAITSRPHKMHPKPLYAFFLPFLATNEHSKLSSCSLASCLCHDYNLRENNRQFWCFLQNIPLPLRSFSFRRFRLSSSSSTSFL